MCLFRHNIVMDIQFLTLATQKNLIRLRTIKVKAQELVLSLDVPKEDAIRIQQNIFFFPL
jgi:hypothetical protein